jgi:uroporphyrinogen decarboxylase
MIDSLGVIMTRRENFFRTVRREGTPDWLPLDFGMSKITTDIFRQHAGADADPCEYFNFDGRWLGAGPLMRPTPDWRALYYADGSLPEGAEITPDWGVARIYNAEIDDFQDYFPLRHAETAADVDAYPWPDMAADARYADLPARIQAVQASDHIAIVGQGISSFESAWNIRGFETLLLDMAEGSPVARRLFDHFYELGIRCAEQVARAGADVMNTGADVATQRGPLMSPATWRDYVFPLLRDSIAAAKAIKPDLLVDYHSCGCVIDMVDGFIEAGIDILNPVQPEAMDIAELKDRFGDRLSFHGGIGVQSVLPFGTPDEVRAATRRTIEILGAGGGYICCTSHTIRPETPWENILAMVETVREYGQPPV